MTAAAVPEFARPAVPAASADTASLLAALDLASALAEQAHAHAFALALDQWGNIVVPPLSPGRSEDQALIRSIAPLYLAAQLEEAALVPAVETLTALAISGGLEVDLGPAVPLIRDFWQQRNERFHANERRAFFGRLFGADQEEPPSGTGDGQGPLNTDFENLMIDLSEALYKLDEEVLAGGGIGPRGQTRVALAARSLAENLLSKGGGMTAFAAKEIVATVASAVRILQQPQVQRAVGARSLWMTVQAVARRYLHTELNTSVYVTRGKSGLIMLSWLADSLPRLNAGQPVVTLDHPVIGAAAEWLQASLTIREAGTPAGA